MSSAWRLGGPQVEGRTRRTRRGCQPPTTCSTSSLLSPATGPKKEWKRGETKSEKEEKERERWRCQWSRHPGPACQPADQNNTHRPAGAGAAPLPCHGLPPQPTRLEITAIAGVVELRLGWERLKMGLESCLCFATI